MKLTNLPLFGYKTTYNLKLGWKLINLDFWSGIDKTGSFKNRRKREIRFSVMDNVRREFKTNTSYLRLDYSQVIITPSVSISKIKIWSNKIIELQQKKKMLTCCRLVGNGFGRSKVCKISVVFCTINAVHKDWIRTDNLRCMENNRLQYMFE